PVCEAEMQLRAASPRHPAVRDVANHDVLELVLALRRDGGELMRTDELAAFQHIEPPQQLVARRRRRLVPQVRDGSRPKRVPDNRRVLRHTSLGWLELVDARPDQRLEARRDRDRLALAQMPARLVDDALVLEHLDQLFEEERVPARTLEQRFGCWVR